MRKKIYKFNYIFPAQYKIEFPNILHNTELLEFIPPNQVLILTNLEEPAVLLAKSAVESDVYLAKSSAPETKVGVTLVNEVPPKEVPIPFVITFDVRAVKLPVELVL